MSKQNRTMCQKCLKAKHDECEGCECIHNRTPIYHTTSGTVINQPEPTIQLTFNESATVKLLRFQLAECQRERDEAKSKAIDFMLEKERAQQQLQQMKEAIVLCMEPLEAIRMSVKWELCESIKESVVKATDAGRRALLKGKE